MTERLYEISSLIKKRKSIPPPHAFFTQRVQLAADLRQTRRFYCSVSCEVSLTSACRCSMSSVICLKQHTVFFSSSPSLLFFPLGSSACGVNAKTRGRPRGWADGEVALNKCEMQKIWKREGERRTERDGQKKRDEDEEEKQSSEVCTCTDGRLVHRDSLSLRLQAAGEEKHLGSARRGSTVRTNSQRCIHTDAMLLFLARLRRTGFSDAAQFRTLPCCCVW